jgi:hypothetical protein
MQKQSTIVSTRRAKREEIGERLFTALTLLEQKSNAIREHLPGYDDEQLKVLFAALEGASTISWQLQSDIVVALHRSGRTGDNTINGIAKFLEVPERRVHELFQIHTQIIERKPGLRELKLEKGHYLEALRARSHNLDPVKVLEHAADNEMGVRDLRRYIHGKEKKGARTTYYGLQHTDTDRRAEVVQERYLSPSARIVTIRGRRYLELREYEDS